MISKFRKGADSLLVRILLGLIAFSFVGVGGAAFINGNSSGDVVSFSETDSISFEEFHIAKAKENIEALKIKMVDKEKQVEAIVASDIKTVETAVVNEVEKIQKAI